MPAQPRGRRRADRNSMGKIYYDEYNLVLNKKAYTILVPKIPLEEVWVMPETGRYHAEAFVEGDGYLLQGLWDTLVTLTLEKDAIIYFPTRHIPQLQRMKAYRKNYDMVFCNHQRQMPGYRWRLLRKMMKFVQPNLRVIHYSYRDFLKRSERIWEQYRRSSRYFLRRHWPRERVSGRTLFVAGSIELNCESVALVYEFMRRDLEREAADPDGWFPHVYVLGFEYYYVTKELYERKKKMINSRKYAVDPDGKEEGEL